MEPDFGLLGLLLVGGVVYTLWMMFNDSPSTRAHRVNYDPEHFYGKQ